MLLNEAVAGRLQAIRREFPSAWAGLARLLPGLEPEEARCCFLFFVLYIQHHLFLILFYIR